MSVELDRPDRAFKWRREVRCVVTRSDIRAVRADAMLLAWGRLDPVVWATLSEYDGRPSDDAPVLLSILSVHEDGIDLSNFEQERFRVAQDDPIRVTRSPLYYAEVIGLEESRPENASYTGENRRFH